MRHCNCGLLVHVMLYKWALVIQKLCQHYFFVQTPECMTSRGLWWDGMAPFFACLVCSGLK